MIRVMLVDDQARELEGMRSIIRWEEMDMQVVQAAADARDALAYARQNGVDLVITDVMMPDMDGLALMEELRALSPWTKVICVSCFDDYKFVSGAVNRGACGYLLKPILSGELKTLLRRVQGDIAREQAALCARDGHAPCRKTKARNPRGRPSAKSWKTLRRTIARTFRWTPCLRACISAGATRARCLKTKRA